MGNGCGLCLTGRGGRLRQKLHFRPNDAVAQLTSYFGLKLSRDHGRRFGLKVQLLAGGVFMESIAKTLELAGKYAWAVFATAALLLFMPDRLATQLALEQFRRPYRGQLW